MKVRLTVLFLLLSLSAMAQDVAARHLSLDEALRMAEGTSEDVEIAQAGVTRARGEQIRARSEYLPQLFGSVSYDRTLASEFEDAFQSSAPAPPPCDPLSVNTSAPVEARVTELERFLGCDGSAGGFDFSNLPFGQRNVYRANLSFSQNLWTGGRLSAQTRLAAASRRVAEIGVDSAKAELLLNVTQAYYDAALAQTFVAISEASLEQAEATYKQVRMQREVGRQSEFEELRAQVSRDNQTPIVIRARAARDQAMLRLKQLIHVPANQALTLDADLNVASLAVPQRFEADLAAQVARPTEERAPVRQAATAIDIGEAGVKIARSQRLPSIAVNSAYGRVAYPQTLMPTSLGDWRTNWTVGLTVQLPIFTGGRIKGDETVARANLQEADARLRQVKQFATLDNQNALDQLRSAEATWEASAGTVQQAARAYEIAELRYREGISTQLELSDARVLLQQARANRAQAGRDLQVARVRVALLPNLPIGAGSTFAAQSSAQQQSAAQAGAQQSTATSVSTTPTQQAGAAQGAAAGTQQRF